MCEAVVEWTWPASVRAPPPPPHRRRAGAAGPAESDARVAGNGGAEASPEARQMQPVGVGPRPQVLPGRFPRLNQRGRRRAVSPPTAGGKAQAALESLLFAGFDGFDDEEESDELEEESVVESDFPGEDASPDSFEEAEAAALRL